MIDRQTRESKQAAYQKPIACQPSPLMTIIHKVKLDLGSRRQEETDLVVTVTW